MFEKRNPTSFGAVCRIRLGEDRTPTMLLMLPENGQRRWEMGPARLQGPWHPRAFLCGCGCPRTPDCPRATEVFSATVLTGHPAVCSVRQVATLWVECADRVKSAVATSGAVSRPRMCRPPEQKLQSLLGGGNAQVKHDLTVFYCVLFGQYKPGAPLCFMTLAVRLTVWVSFWSCSVLSGLC